MIRRSRPRIGCPRHRAIGTFACLLCLPSACSPALGTPPEVSVLAPRGVELGSTAPEQLITEAMAAFARRPDIDAVTLAAALWGQAAAASPSGTEALIGAARAQIWLSDHLESADGREHAAVSAVYAGQLCSARAPAEPRCDYWLALAVGRQARERASTASDGVDVMEGLLRSVIERAPQLDRGGPDRVLGLLLLRAPGWPTGPGNDEAGLEHTRAALRIDPDYPPNHLAVAEGLAALGERGAAIRRYRQALADARALEPSLHPDAPEWIEEALRELEALGVARR